MKETILKLSLNLEDKQFVAELNYDIITKESQQYIEAQLQLIAERLIDDFNSSKEELHH